MNNKVSFLTQNFGKYDTSSIDSYMKIGGFSALRKAVGMDGEDIATLIAENKVRGRGGAEYDMGRKWSQARKVPGNNHIIICNADEGETTTFKDRELIKNDPFNLIEAMIIAAYVMRATDGYIYMRAEYACFRPLLLNAIRQAHKYGFLGKNILGIEGFDYEIHLYSGAGAYVCGEGTALIRSIEGKAGRPRMKPPFVKVSGAFARPTCLQNVESLSLVPHLLLDDEKVYQSYGVGDSVGTKMISVGGNVRHPGAFEIPFGTTVRDIIYGLAGGIQGDRKIRLIQFGGASGKIATDDILDTPYTYQDLRAHGVMVGSGALCVVDERTSVIDFLRINQDFFSEESCGQCTPCREGNLHIKIILDKIKAGTATKEDIAVMEKIARVMSMSSLCGLGETAQNTLRSAIEVFPEVFAVGGAEA
ncbi:MAG: SLBB domain-containing protein [Selenomonas sp.]|jgi:NADH-quinone oxidoreductase subunit F|nr:SLBB domain-containing protein [Selenomonas sp.]MCI7331248.1 SLBB domain-containing protein [Selenomonadaceae bacterium]MDD6120151.1 NADH-ubiquinone oxidoreductase-F iron-sulfur binding region domain-containing protein [Selenomonadaceae bacterium]MDD7056182.1 NADH-ubiquinone oxidoreductase-F iron-sulfur binding region domain-containing protein [Selenomonadaceae bacterium]MDY3916403.1 NADH-ubiquinone oxidoreductase-F iron-sulfur binding region domain-containing protein [Selenomonadaceae bacte